MNELQNNDREKFIKAFFFFFIISPTLVYIYKKKDLKLIYVDSSCVFNLKSNYF